MSLFVLSVVLLPAVKNKIVDASEFKVSMEQTPDLMIGGEETEHLFQISQVAVDEDGFIYVTDFHTYFLTKFSPDGEFIAKTGRQGQGPGDFPSIPRLLRYSNSSLYVIGRSGSDIHLFDKNLKYKTTLNPFHFSYIIAEFKAINSRLFFNLPSLERPVSIIEIEIKDDYSIKNLSDYFDPAAMASGYNLDYWIVFCLDNQGDMILAKRFHDKVEKRKPDFSLVWEKSFIPGHKTEYSINTFGEKVPNHKSMTYRSVQVDRFDNIYLLRGWEIGVISPGGKLISLIGLPNFTPFILIDRHNYIYMRGPEDSLVRYKLIIERNAGPEK